MPPGKALPRALEKGLVPGNLEKYLKIWDWVKNKVAALLDYAPKAWFGTNAKYFKFKYSGAFDDKNT